MVIIRHTGHMHDPRTKSQAYVSQWKPFDEPRVASGGTEREFSVVPVQESCSDVLLATRGAALCTPSQDDSNNAFVTHKLTI